MLGRGHRIAERRVHDHDAARRGRRNVNIVDADAGAADNFQSLGSFQDLGRHFRRRADGEAIVIGDRREQRVLVLTEVGHVIDIDPAIAENLHCRLGQLVGNQYAWRHDHIPRS
jgi:hypothetical protein